MKLSRKQTRTILAFRRTLLNAWWPKMKWKDYISFYYYFKCCEYEYGGKGRIYHAWYNNWKNNVSIKISENNPFKSRYYESKN